MQGHKPVEQDSDLQELSVREREVLELIAAGYNNAEIAHKLVISPKTVRNHITSIFSKLQVADRAQAIRPASRRWCPSAPGRGHGLEPAGLAVDPPRGHRQAVIFCRGIPKGQLEMLEQPVSPADLDGLRQVTKSSPIPVLADQSVTGPASALDPPPRHVVRRWAL